jgi:hypothetical protein
MRFSPYTSFPDDRDGNVNNEDGALKCKGVEETIVYGRRARSRWKRCIDGTDYADYAMK